MPVQIAQVMRVLGLLPRLRFVLLAVAMSLTTHAAVSAQTSAYNRAQARDTVMTATTEDTSIRPFRVNVPEETLVDLRRRLAATRWPDQENLSNKTEAVRLPIRGDL